MIENKKYNKMTTQVGRKWARRVCQRSEAAQNVVDRWCKEYIAVEERRKKEYTEKERVTHLHAHIFSYFFRTCVTCVHHAYLCNSDAAGLYLGYNMLACM